MRPQAAGRTPRRWSAGLQEGLEAHLIRRESPGQRLPASEVSSSSSLGLLSSVALVSPLGLRLQTGRFRRCGSRCRECRLDWRCSSPCWLQRASTCLLPLGSLGPPCLVRLRLSPSQAWRGLLPEASADAPSRCLRLLLWLARDPLWPRQVPPLVDRQAKLQVHFLHAQLESVDHPNPPTVSCWEPFNDATQDPIEVRPILQSSQSNLLASLEVWWHC